MRAGIEKILIEPSEQVKKTWMFFQLLLLVFLFSIGKATAQTLDNPGTFISGCATVGESFSFSLTGAEFRMNDGSINTKVIFRDDSNGNLLQELLIDPFSPNLINITLPASSPALQQGRVVRIQVANRDKSTPNFDTPSSPVYLRVYPKLSPSVPTGTLSVCVNSTSSYTIPVVPDATGYEWSIVSGGATILSGGDTRTAEVRFGSTAGTVRLGVRAKNQCGVLGPATPLDVTLTPLPTVTADAKQVCIGSSTVTLTGSPSGGTWSGTRVTGNSFDAAGLAAGSYAVTYTFRNNNGCENSATTTVTVNPLPTLQITNPAPVCSPGTVNLTAASVTAGSTTGFTYTYWTDENATTPLSSPAAVGTSGTYYIKGTNATTTCSVIRPVIVTINPLPTLQITNPGAVCAPGTADLTAAAVTTGSTAGLTYTYWTNSTATTALANPTTVGTSGTYYIRGTDPNTNCFVISPVSVTINPQPVLSSSLTGVACSGLPFSYTPASTTAGTTFTWTRAAVAGVSNVDRSGSGAINETLINTTSAPVVITYRVTLTSGQSCTNVQEVKVTVNPNPRLSSSLTPPAVCNNGTFAYTPTSETAGATYSWTRVADSFGNTATSGTGSISQVLRNTSTAPIQVTYEITTSASSCGGEKQNVVVTVNPSPLLSSNLTPAAVCSSTSFTYTPTSATAGATFSWTRAAVTGISNAASSGTGAVSETLVNTTTSPIVVIYNYTTTANGCASAAQSVRVTVNPQPPATITPTGPTDFCSGNSVTLNAQSGLTSYEWFRSSDGTTYTQIPNSSSNSLVVTESGSFYVRMTNSSGCQTTSAPITVKVVQVDAGFTSVTYTGATEFCQGGSVLLQAPNNSRYDYQWYNGTTLVGSASSYLATTSGNYTVTISSSFQGVRCTKTSDVIPVTVTPTVVNTLAAPDVEICSGGTAPQLVGNAATGGTGSFVYTWESSTISATDGFAAISNTNTVSYSPGAPTQTTWYRRRVTSGKCDVYSTPVRVTVSPVIANNNLTVADLVVCGGQPVPTLTATTPAGGNGTYTYQWESSTTSATTDFNAITATGATAANYSTGNLSQTTWFRRVVRSGACSNTSGVVRVEVTPSITNVNIAGAQAICSGSAPARLTGAAAGGTGSYAYQWEQSSDGTTFTAIGGATEQEYTPGVLTADTWYRRRVSSGGCSVYSSSVKITVTPAVTNHVVTGASSFCVNATATALSATFSGGSTTPSTNTFQWQQSTSSAGPWDNIAGATGSGYMPPTTTVGTVFYRRILNTGSCSNQPSEPFAVTIKPLPVINSVSNAVYCAGATAPAISFSSSMAGSTFAWTSNADVGFGTSGSGNIGAFTARNTGTTPVMATVTVRATADSCPGPALTFTITVNPIPVLSISNTLSSSYCESQQAITLTGLGSPAGGTFTVNGTTATVFDPSSLKSGTYTVVYAYTDPSTNCSNTVSRTVVVNPPPTVSFSGVTDNQLIYSGQSSIPLTGSPSGGTWSWPGTTNSTASSFSPCAAFAEAIKTAPAGALEVDVPITYTFRNANGCEGTATRTVKIRRSTYNVVTFSSIKPFCKGDNVTHTVSVYRDATVIYPYLVNAAGDPVRADGVTPIGPNELPVTNPAYPFPAGTPDIIKALAYRYFQPIVTGGVLLPASQFTYQWTKNQNNFLGSDGFSYANAGLSSLEYYAAEVSGIPECGVVFDKKLSYRVYGGVLEDYNISIAVSKNPLCAGEPTQFTANLDAGFDWAKANLKMVWKLRRGGRVYIIKEGSTSNLTLSNAEIEAALTAQGVIPATLQNGDEVFIDFTTDIQSAVGNSNCRGNETTAPIAMRIDQPAAVNQNTVYPTITKCEGETATFVATATGTNLNVQWFKDQSTTALVNGGNYSIVNSTTNGVTTSTLRILKVALTDAGVYNASFTNATSTACRTTSATTGQQLIVNPVPRIFNMKGGTYCHFFSQGINLVLDGSTQGVTYELLKNDVSFNPKVTLPGTGSALDFGTYPAGNYSIVGTGAAGCVNTSVATATITSQIDPNTQPISGDLIYKWISNNTFEFTVNNTGLDFGPNPTYDWYRKTPSTSWTKFATTTVGTITVSGAASDVEIRVEVIPSDGRCMRYVMITGAAVPFPVELIGFKADKKGENVLLSWTTAVETNNRGFDVQVSEDGVNYRSLAFVASKNSNSSVKLTYSFTDTEKNKRLIRYYRLKQVDTDNTATFFGPVSVSFGEFSERISAYPNPFDTAISFEIETDEAGEVEVSMSDITGKRLLSRTIQVQQGKGTYTLQVEKTTPAGAYIITTRKGDQVQHFRLIRQ